MAIKIKDLVERLQRQDQDEEVEFIVVRTNGLLVSMDVETQAGDMAKLLSMFGVVTQ